MDFIHHNLLCYKVTSFCNIYLFIYISPFPFFGPVKKSVIGQDLQAYAQGLLGLLPAFCRYPVDAHKKFGSLAELIIKFLKKESFMHQTIAVALQVIFLSLPNGEDLTFFLLS